MERGRGFLYGWPYGIGTLYVRIYVSTAYRIANLRLTPIPIHGPAFKLSLRFQCDFTLIFASM
jgi:hypothetical protein